MPQTLAEKLRIRAGQRIRTINAPPDLETLLYPLPANVTFVTRGAADQWYCFVKDQATLRQVWPKIWSDLRPGNLAWFFYPKANSGLQTDLTRDKGWEQLLQYPDELQWNSLVSFNDTWSGAGYKRVETGAIKRNAAVGPESPWIDRINRVVTLPPVMYSLLKKHPEQATLFDKMSFTHKKEYVEWITSAKKEETLQRRLEQFIERLKALS